jgi:hypothetical protein
LECGTLGAYGTGTLNMVARELGKYKLDLVGAQEVRREKGGPERAEDFTIVMKKMRIIC